MSGRQICRIAWASLVASALYFIATDLSPLRAQTASNVICNGCVGGSDIANFAVSAGKLSANSVSNPKIATGAVTQGKIANGAVTGAKIANFSVSAGKLSTNSVSNPKIVAGAVTAGKIAINAVTEHKIATGAVTRTKIAPFAVKSGNLAENSVTGPKIASSAVTQGKIAPNAVTTGKITPQIILGGSSTNGQLTLRTGSNEDGVLLDGSSGNVTNLFSNTSTDSNGLVKAWARINSDGTVNACWRCNTNVGETQRLGLGIYEVDFTPLSTDVTGRPRSAVPDGLGTTPLPTARVMDVADQLGDASSVRVHTSDTNGADTDTQFVLIIY